MAKRLIAAAMMTIASAVLPATAQDAVTLPGGASALNETHGDWVVHCEAAQQQIVCALQQEQADTNSKQRIIAIELAPGDGTLNGTLVLPFGLALEKGVALQVDGGAPLPSLRFRTCLPAGCLVNLTLEAPTVAALTLGTVLKVTATADNGSEAPFNISLKGFSGALDRTIELSKR